MLNLCMLTCPRPQDTFRRPSEYRDIVHACTKTGSKREQYL
jgi:hypothetical protein